MSKKELFNCYSDPFSKKSHELLYSQIQLHLFHIILDDRQFFYCSFLLPEPHKDRNVDLVRPLKNNWMFYVDLGKSLIQVPLHKLCPNYMVFWMTANSFWSLFVEMTARSHNKEVSFGLIAALPLKWAIVKHFAPHHNGRAGHQLLPSECRLFSSSLSILIKVNKW